MRESKCRFSNQVFFSPLLSATETNTYLKHLPAFNDAGFLRVSEIMNPGCQRRSRARDRRLSYISPIGWLSRAARKTSSIQGRNNVVESRNLTRLLAHLVRRIYTANLPISFILSVVDTAYTSDKKDRRYREVFLMITCFQSLFPRDNSLEFFSL